ncbi:Gpi mannosyltransferase 1, partial [Globisporangium splendens]
MASQLQTQLLGGALLLRLALIAYGELQDRLMSVKYTDVDYDVYTDASREMAAGNSPFDRTTYRYTPVLAFLLLPNVLLHEAFGKLFFVGCDLLAGHVLFQILRLRGLPEKSAFCVAVPPVFDQHLDARQRGLDRGGARAAHAALPHAQTARTRCDHIYPIVYALAFLVFLNGRYNVSNAKWSQSCSSSFCFWVHLGGWLNRDRMLFGLISGSLFLALIAAFYRLYGFQFLYEAYLYHFTRTDNRHNFSVYFYDLYLRYRFVSGCVSPLFLMVMPSSSLLQQIQYTVGLWRWPARIPATTGVAGDDLARVRRRHHLCALCADDGVCHL